MAGIVWTGQVNFTDSSDVGTTGVAYLTLTPDCGMSNLPVLAAGDPGVPPTFRNINTNQVAAGTSCPASTWSLVSAGGPGVASVYDLDLYVNSGAQGIPGTFAIAGASDIAGTLTDGFTLIWSASASKWEISPVPRNRVYAAVPVTGFMSYYGNAYSSQMASLSIPAQPFNWRPVVSGYAKAQGTANTNVDLAAYLNSATSGIQVGYGYGVPASVPPPVTLVPSFGADISGSSTYGMVTAGTSTNVVMVAKQTNTATTDPWSVNALYAAFTVEVVPV